MTATAPRPTRGQCTYCRGLNLELDRRGRIAAHTVAEFIPRIGRAAGIPPTVCPGAGRGSVEAREASRNRAREKRRAKHGAVIAAVRDEAAVLLDALILKRADLDDEYGKERRGELLRIALTAYRLDHPGVKVGHGILWWSGKVARGARAHKLFCRFCGVLVARFPIGQWIKLSPDDRDVACGRHVFVCALQRLAGIRQAVEPGTMLEGYDGQLFDDALARRCNACGSPAGVTCVEADLDGHVRYAAEPHDARRVA